LVKTGIKITPSRVARVSRNALIKIGEKVAASYVYARAARHYIYSAVIRMGMGITASRKLAISRVATIPIGIKIIATWRKLKMAVMGISKLHWRTGISKVVKRDGD